MNDFVSETKACDLLARLFRSRGFAIMRNVLFREYGVEFHADGWDPKARVGFEFLTSEDDDHDDLTLEGYKTLMAAQQRGDLSLFIIDEVETLSAAELTATAHEFLDEVAAAAQARARRATSGRGKPARGQKAGTAKKAAAAPSRGTKARASGKQTAAKKVTAAKKATVAKKGRAGTAKKSVRGRKPSAR